MATEYQIKALKNKLATFKPDDKGKYPSAYYALENKIKILEQQQRTLEEIRKWNDFLSQ